MITTNQRLLALLQSGENRTVASLASSVQISRPSVSKRVLELRRSGYPVYRNIVKVNGRATTAYRLGTASKQIVAAGYAALALAKHNTFVGDALRAQNIIQ